MIDSREAQAALDDIQEMVAWFRQSRTYDIASQIMIFAGVMVLAGNIATYVAPRYAYYIWPGINVLNVVGAAVISLMSYRRTGVRAFDYRVLVAFLLFYGFGNLCVSLGHFGWRELTVFWPVYFMLFYCSRGCGSAALFLPSV